jgi:hypothetical protein
MGRPAAGYYTKAGERVPSVTEIMGKFKNADPLIGWAFKRGYASGQAAAKGLPAPRSAYAEKEEAAQAGQIAHDMLECHILGKPYEYDGKKPSAEVMERAKVGYMNGVRWLNGTRYTVLNTEVSLVSEKYRFGGTRDAMFGVERDDGPVAYRLGDWKTSNAIYADYLIQVAAYDILAEECEGISVSGYDILRFSKEHADFQHYSFTDLRDAKNAFVLMCRLYPLICKLEDRV